MIKTQELVTAPRRTYVSGNDATECAAAVTGRLGPIDTSAVLVFASPGVDGSNIVRTLATTYRRSAVIGCTTAGEFTDQRGSTGGAAVIALPRAIVPRAAATLADFSGGVAQSLMGAVGSLEEQLDMRLFDTDPHRYLGIVLVDGVRGREEEVNRALASLAPGLPFIGGSAADDMAFLETRVYHGGRWSADGAVLLVLELAVPYCVLRSCSFSPTPTGFTVTEADESDRVVWQLDGQPAAAAYAEAIGCEVDQLGPRVFMSHPLGSMNNGQPWVRSPQRVIGEEGIKFFGQVPPGAQLSVMAGTDLVGETAAAVRAASAKVGGASGAIMFNDVLRRLELDASGTGSAFLRAFGGVPTAGFHSYGESCLGHTNHTLTGVVFGRPTQE